MMNFFFAFIILISFFFSAINGTINDTTAALLDGGSSAVTLTISLAGALCFWCGLMRVAQKAGITAFLSRLLSPLVTRLMPSLKENAQAKELVSMNIVSNLLGLGNAATPLGLSAMKLMNTGSLTRASDDMVTFVVLNTASIQLIPSTLAVLRQNSGSQTPLDILPCVWISSIFSVVVGITVSRLMRGTKR